jgi:PKD domain
MAAEYASRVGRALLGLFLAGLFLALPSVAQASTAPQSFIDTGSVCQSGMGVALNGGVNWFGLSPGTITLSWGDQSAPISSSAVFPAAHTYSKSGEYTIKVTANDSAGTSNTATYVVQVPLTTCTYSIQSPISLIRTINGIKAVYGGNLAGGEALTFDVKVSSNSGQPVNDTPVWLTDSTEVGSASGCCYAYDSGAQSLALQPQVFVTGVDTASGTVEITYTAPELIPSQGLDLVCAANADTHPTVSGEISFQYADLSSLLGFLPIEDFGGLTDFLYALLDQGALGSGIPVIPHLCVSSATQMAVSVGSTTGVVL